MDKLALMKAALANRKKPGKKSYSEEEGDVAHPVDNKTKSGKKSSKKSKKPEVDKKDSKKDKKRPAFFEKAKTRGVEE